MATFTSVTSTDQYVPDSTRFTVDGTEFANIFNNDEGHSDDPEWHEKMMKLIEKGEKPIYTTMIPKDAIARAYLDVCEGISKENDPYCPNIFFVKLALAAGINTEVDILTLFKNARDWYEGSCFRAALGEFLGLYNTQFLTITTLVAREESTMPLITLFWVNESIFENFPEKLAFMHGCGMLERYVETLITGEHDENNSIREDIIKRFHEETLPGMKNGRTQE